MTAERSQFRRHALDGALLLFRPSSGDTVRIDSPTTRALRRIAPRVVFFGLSHACNLSCSFCSRDRSIASRWDADEAVALLSGLSEAGTLEVAFGGGEPLAYAGFDALLARLHAETSLALHLTTNGTLVDAARARALGGVTAAPIRNRARAALGRGARPRGRRSRRCPRRRPSE